MILNNILEWMFIQLICFASRLKETYFNSIFNSVQFNSSGFIGMTTYNTMLPNAS